MIPLAYVTQIVQLEPKRLLSLLLLAQSPLAQADGLPEIRDLGTARRAWCVASASATLVATSTPSGLATRPTTYVLPPERRLPGARELVDQKAYFILHAPRQVGKTTALSTLAQELTFESREVGARVRVPC